MLSGKTYLMRGRVRYIVDLTQYRHAISSVVYILPIVHPIVSILPNIPRLTRIDKIGRLGEIGRVGGIVLFKPPIRTTTSGGGVLKAESILTCYYITFISKFK